MHKGDFAVLILSLATSRERAVSIVGDLLEGGEACSPVRFWTVVARTALSQGWAQIAAAPFGMARAAILAGCVELGLDLLLMVVFYAVSLPMTLISKGEFPRDLPGWLMPWSTNLLSNLLIPFGLGRWLSRRYAGREGAVGFTLAIFHAVISLCVGFIFWQGSRSSAEAHVGAPAFSLSIHWAGDILSTLAWTAFYPTLYLMLVLAGSASVRAKFSR